MTEYNSIGFPHMCTYLGHVDGEAYYKLQKELKASRDREKVMREALDAVVGRYELVGDSDHRRQGVSLGIYTVCKRALSTINNPLPGAVMAEVPMSEDW